MNTSHSKLGFGWLVRFGGGEGVEVGGEKGKEVTASESEFEKN
jgi:hypothetical protein